MYLAVAVFAMFGFGYALVPLYDIFCEITGIGGKPTIAKLQSATPQSIDLLRDVTIEFTGTSNNHMQWQINPMVKKTRVHPGEIHEINYRVKNTANRTIVAQAIPSVSPIQAAKHLVKLECFCFTNQTLNEGEEREMPVRFYVASELPKEIRTLTLSYSFFELKNERGS